MPKTKNANGVTERQRAYDSLRTTLILRRVPAGQRIREPEWTQRIGANRTALREALAHLCSEGLVVEGEKCGYCVPSYTPDELDEIRECRQMVESAAVERLIRAGRHRGAHLDRLRELCDELEWILVRGYSIEIVEVDYLFHETLVQLSGNKRLILVHRCLPQTIGGDPQADNNDRAAQARRVLGDHREILQAIRKGHAGAAANLLHHHYEVERAEDASESLLMAIAQ
jgi:DNA-binding GntR family transcriptional regulator